MISLSVGRTCPQSAALGIRRMPKRRGGDTRALPASANNLGMHRQQPSESPAERVAALGYCLRSTGASAEVVATLRRSRAEFGCSVNRVSWSRPRAPLAVWNAKVNGGVASIPNR